MRNLIYVGLMLPVFMMGVDYYMSRFNEYKPTELGINQ